MNNNPGNTFLWLSPTWGTTNNNGNLQGMDEYNGGAPLYPAWLHFTAHYYYDGANRFFYGYEDGASCPAAGNYACWFRTYDYDAVGNRWLAANGGLPVQTATPTSNIYNANNRMTTRQNGRGRAKRMHLQPNQILAHGVEDNLGGVS